jgi:micrococcal nuclease
VTWTGSQPFPGGIYRARCTNVVDGDTVDLTVDLGFHVYAAVRFRLLGINAPEMRAKDSATRALAQKAKEQMAAWLLIVGDWPLLVSSMKPDTDDFGRWLARISWKDAAGAVHCANDDLLAAGLAVVYRP